MKKKLIILLIVFLLMSLGYEEVNADIINNYDDINVVAEDIEGINGYIEGKVKIDGNATIIENDDGDNTIEVNNKGKYNNKSEIHSDVEYTKITIEKNEDGKIEKSVISVNDKNEMSIVSNSSDNILVQDNKIEINDSLELKYKDKSGGFISNCDNTSKAIIIGSIALIMCSLLGIYIIKHKRK